MKLWIDDVRPAPGDMFHDWIWCKSVNIAKEIIIIQEDEGNPIEFIDIDYDAGDFFQYGAITLNSLIGSKRLVVIIPFISIA